MIIREALSAERGSTGYRALIDCRDHEGPTAHISMYLTMYIGMHAF
jgi:hypothetical protein